MGDEINERSDPPERFVLSKDLDLCEGCGLYKHIIVRERRNLFARLFHILLFPFYLIGHFLLLAVVSVGSAVRYKR